jgi:hypothetical protein
MLSSDQNGLSTCPSPQLTVILTHTKTVPRCGISLQAAEAQRAHPFRSERGGVVRVPEHTERELTANPRLSICLELLGGQK